MRQVISNLVGNALEHGSSDGDVVVSLRGDGPDIVLDVRNGGRPISPAILPRNAANDLGKIIKRDLHNAIALPFIS